MTLFPQNVTDGRDTQAKRDSVTGRDTGGVWGGSSPLVRGGKNTDTRERDCHASAVTESVTQRRDSDSPSASGSRDRHHHAVTWVLCWSKNQNALHVETLDQHLSLNRECYTDDIGGDFRLLLIGTETEVADAAQAARSTLMAREALA